MYFEFLMLLLKSDNNLEMHTILTAIVIHSIEVELLRPICNLNRKIITQASLVHFGRCIIFPAHKHDCIGIILEQAYVP